MIRQRLEGRSEAELRRARHALDALFGGGSAQDAARRSRIALNGLRFGSSK